MKFRDFIEESTGEKLVSEILKDLSNQIPVKERKRLIPVAEKSLYSLLNSGNLDGEHVKLVYAQYGANFGHIEQQYFRSKK